MITSILYTYNLLIIFLFTSVGNNCINICRDVIECDEFLSLSFEDVIQIISYDDLNVPFEETVGGIHVIF